MKIYYVGNRTSNAFFQDEEDAKKYQGYSSAAAGLTITEIDVLPISTRSKVCPMCKGTGKAPGYIDVEKYYEEESPPINKE